MLFIVYSGCGAGEGKKDSGSTGSGGATQAKAGDKAGGQTASAAVKGAIDFSLVTPDHFAAIVIHPRRLSASPLVAEKLKDEKIAEAIKKFGLDPSEVEQIVVLLSMDEKQPGNSEPIPVIVTRFTHDVDAKEVLTKIQAASAKKESKPIKEVTVAGKTCFDLGGEKNAGLAYALSKNTIVLTVKENMGKVLAGNEPKGPLYERLKKASTDNDLIVAVELEKYPGLDKQIDAAKAGAPPMGQNYLDGAKTLRGVTLGLNLTGDSLLQIVMETKDAAGAETVETLLKDGVKLLDGALAGFKQNVPKEAKADFADAFKLGDEALAGVSVTKSGSAVTIVLKRPASMDKIGPLVDKAIQRTMMGMVPQQKPMVLPPQDEK